MQLKKPDSIRSALAAATCGLLAGAHGGAHAADGAVTGKWEVDSAVLLYAEQDRVKAVEPVVRMKKQLTEDESIAFKVVVDALTGASPNGAVPSTVPQTFTSPSGENAYTTPANQTPLDPGFHDTRAAFSFEWSRPLGTQRRIVYQGHASLEYDYMSLGAGATVSQDYNNRNTTFSAGLSFNADTVKPVGGVPTGLTPMPAYPGASKSTTGDSDGKNVTDLLLGVTQVISPTMLAQFNYTWGRDSGYLTDPYKLVSVVDPVSGLPTQTFFEHRPDARTRNALYARTLNAFGKNVLDLSYRYFWDDWGIKAHTADVRYRYDLGGHYLEPHLRYSRQSSAADFFRPFLLTGETVNHVSADYRLSEMTTTTFGVKYGIPTRNGEFSVRLESMNQKGEDHPANAPGQLASQDLFPDTRAVLLQLSYSFLW